MKLRPFLASLADHNIYFPPSIWLPASISLAFADPRPMAEKKLRLHSLDFHALRLEIWGPSVPEWASAFWIERGELIGDHLMFAKEDYSFGFLLNRAKPIFLSTFTGDAAVVSTQHLDTDARYRYIQQCKKGQESVSLELW
ncbi:MAG: hypothetical protein M3Y72_02080 [Acidobacteriota bacterium]|nr:hypothetical protein [Acidobacteriota bacterium]